MEISDNAKHFTARVVQPKAVATGLAQPNGLRSHPEYFRCHCSMSSHS
jgi:hypothetical protein